MPLIDEPFSFNYFGHIIIARSLGTIAMPDITKLISAHVVPITFDGNIIAVNIISRGWDIPGGHIDAGELSPITALSREASEEAQITVVDPVLIDVLELKSDTLSSLVAKPYMALYAARVDKVDEFTPNEEVSTREIMTTETFIENYFGNKSYATQMMNSATDAVSLQ